MGIGVAGSFLLLRSPFHLIAGARESDWEAPMEGRVGFVLGDVFINDKAASEGDAVSEGDVITLKEKSRANGQINENLEAVARRGVPSWLELDKDNFKASVKALPNREELTMPIQEQLIVELYSK